MKVEGFRWLAGLISAHPGGKLHGRTRLQKSVRLLQRIGMPSDYEFKMHHYGPYSEGVQADINLLERLGLVCEMEEPAASGRSYSVFEARSSAHLPEIDTFRSAVDLLSGEDATVLELAATYDMYRDKGMPHPLALDCMRSKKGAKCGEGREAKSLELLQKLRLSDD
jgi:hypothetical protein